MEKQRQRKYYKILSVEVSHMIFGKSINIENIYQVKEEGCWKGYWYCSIGRRTNLR